MEQDCCEHAEWFIADSPQKKIMLQTEFPEGHQKSMPGWIFDTKYFKQVDGDDFEDGGMAIFKIVKGKEKKFIHIFNCHNGYYSHGFTFFAGEDSLREGYL